MKSLIEKMEAAVAANAAVQIDSSYLNGSGGYDRLSFVPAGTIVTDNNGNTWEQDAPAFVIGWEQYPDYDSGYSRYEYSVQEMHACADDWLREE